MASTTSRRLTATALLNIVLDEDSFRSWDAPAEQPPAGIKYSAELEAARDKSGHDESVLTGEGRIRGRRVAVIVSEFTFLAGSIGRAAAQRITEAIERATAEGLPLLAGPASGGTRMQEGTLAFLSMVAITDAVRRHKEKGLPYLVYLRHPTTGGVMASWGSLGHMTVAEPGALLGFLGPRVYEILYDRPFPEGVQTAENLYRCGLIDAVVPPQDLPDIIDRALRILLPTQPAGNLAVPASVDAVPGTRDAWESIGISRHPRRPDLRWLLAAGADDALPLNGTGQGENDPGLGLALARFGTQSCIVLGHQRPRHGGREMGPGSLREARRGMQLAEELQLPLLTVIDTAGADLSPEAEEGGLAGEIARSLNSLIGLAAPSVAVLLGQGSGGGALALLPADRVLAAENAWLSPLPPEGASAIVYRDAAHAPQLAAEQGVNVASLHRIGLVDHIVPEEREAAVDPRGFCADLAVAIEYELSVAAAVPSGERRQRRAAKFATLGL
ncbi:carboxyl transferase domain-containing protein [Arthrobacter sp.]|uniref:carboxyl transferase domain-containing protein n=1 Tax=Arthrobacter sp. TaxID=1667 RepID=UPI003A8F86E4